jgi:hypothetical protein
MRRLPLPERWIAAAVFGAPLRFPPLARPQLRPCFAEVPRSFCQGGGALVVRRVDGLCGRAYDPLHRCALFGGVPPGVYGCGVGLLPGSLDSRRRVSWLVPLSSVPTGRETVSVF